MTAVPAGVPEFVFTELSDARALSSILADFGAAILHKAADAPPAAWGSKCGFSIFDEGDILGSEGKLPALEAELSPGAGDGHGERPTDGPAISDEGTSRGAAKLARQQCCLYSLAQECAGPCPICLEEMYVGHLAWRLPCFHLVHHACAERLYGARKARPLCPLCRFDIARG